MTKLITGVGYLIFDIKFHEYLVTVATMVHLQVIMENHGNSALETLNNLLGTSGLFTYLKVFTFSMYSPIMLKIASRK